MSSAGPSRPSRREMAEDHQGNSEMDSSPTDSREGGVGENGLHGLGEDDDDSARERERREVLAAAYLNHLLQGSPFMDSSPHIIFENIITALHPSNLSRDSYGDHEPCEAHSPQRPSEVGLQLMSSGDFGSNEWRKPKGRNGRASREPSLGWRLLERELGIYTGARMGIQNQLIAQSLVPSQNPDFVIQNNSRCYSGQFSEDGNFFYSCAQDFRVRMYDTSNPYEWKFHKSMEYYDGRWTITDASLSPDNKFLAYSSIMSSVCLANTGPDSDEIHILEFSRDNGDQRNNNTMGDSDYGIWSIRFSGDGRELVAGTSDNCLYVYDIETQTPVLKLKGHTDEVNAVCYGDKVSPHILYSGSDDTTIKIWDRRSMSERQEVGVFMGHTEGLTYVDSKGDGRYVLSNAKDQSMKLWDIRKMTDTDEFNSWSQIDYSSGYDYRRDKYPGPPRRHPPDSSLVTYRGHSVHKTLIRCHFSPTVSSASRYVYTGSADGKVYIYNIDATVKKIINVQESTKYSRSTNACRSRMGLFFHEGYGFNVCIRDVSWHPTAPVLAATSWNGSRGIITVHSWDGTSDTAKQIGGVGEGMRNFDPMMRRM